MSRSHIIAAGDAGAGDSGNVGGNDTVPGRSTTPSETPRSADAAITLLMTSGLTASRAHTAVQEVAGCALVLRSEVGVDRRGRPYLLLTLRGGDGGRIEARWWRYPYPPDRRPRIGDVCWFSGVVDHYAGASQLRITSGRRMSALDPALFARSTRRPPQELQCELAARMAEITDPGLRRLVQTVLSGETYERFCTWPAAHYRHGAVRHGLLAHSLCVAALAEHLAAAYGPESLPYDADVVQAACLLHDIGKTQTLPAIAGAPPPDGAAECDHVTHSVLIVREAAAQIANTTSPHAQACPLDPTRLQRLIHAILAHHGLREWGAPVEPQTVEAWLVHLADLAESRLWGWSQEEQE